MTTEKKITTVDTVQATFPEFVSSCKGDTSTGFNRLAALENIQANSLIYLLDKKYIQTGLESTASVIFAPAPMADAISQAPSHQCWVFSPNPELLMALCKKAFILQTPYKSLAFDKGVHTSAVVDSSADIDASVVVGPHAVIGKNVRIGAHSFVGANCVIEDNVSIGENTTLHPLCYIGHHCAIGNHCEILPNSVVGSEGYGYAHDQKWNHYRISHSGRVVLEDDVHIGANTSIDRGSIEDTIIKKGVKIDNQCHLAHNSVVGENSLLTAQFGMAGSSSIGKNFVTGGKTSVTGHVHITDNVQVAGMSGVTKSIEQPGKYGGFPLQPLQKYLKTKAAIAQIADIRKMLKDLLKEKP